MSLGHLVRRLLGQKYFAPLGNAYRRFFLNPQDYAASFPPLLPGRHLIDIGGGDGILLNHLLARFPELEVTMLDLAPAIGEAVEPQYLPRLRLYPATSLRGYCARSDRRRADYILLCDVLHHVPLAARNDFFADLKALLTPGASLIVKDVEPGGPSSWLYYLADRFVSGDANTSFISRAELAKTAAEQLQLPEFVETQLYRLQPPNYCLVFGPVAPPS